MPGGARPVAGESAGETPRRLPGVGVELLQLRDYVSGDALSRIDWKATARRGSLVSREYSEAQHLEILLVIDAGRGSRVRAGALDRLGLYANVAARLAEHAVSIEDRVGLLVYADARSRPACRTAECARWRGCAARSRPWRATAVNPIRWPPRFRCGAFFGIGAWSCGSRISPSPRATRRSCRR